MAKTVITTDKAIKNIRALINEMDALKVSVNGIGKVSKSNMRQLEGDIKRIDTVTKGLNRKFNTLTKTIKKQKTQIDNLSRSNKKLSNSQTKVISNQKKMGTGFSNIGNIVKQLIAGFGVIAGIQLFGQILKNAYELAKTFDSLKFAMDTVFKSMESVAEAQSFLIGLNKEFGADLVATTERWIKFRAAAEQSGMTLKDTQDIFRTMTKASATLGLKTDELRGIYLALEQMLSKGKVTTEELRRQLGERLPGAMGIMASSMGVTLEQLDKMMKKGEVLSAEVLPGFAKAVELAFGLDQIDNIRTLVTEEQKMITAYQIFIKTVTEGDSVINRSFKNLWGWLTKITERFTFFVADHEQRLQLKTVETDIDVREESMEEAVRIADERRKKLGKIQSTEIREKIQLALEDIGNMKRIDAVGYKDKILAYEKFIKNQTDLLLEYGKEHERIEQELASQRLSGYIKNLESHRKEYEEASAEIDKIIGEKTFSDWIAKAKPEEIEAYNKYKMIMEDTARAISKVRLAKQLLEKGRPSPLTPDSSDKSMRSIYDLENKIKIENLKRYQKANQDEIDSDKTTYAEKRSLLMANASTEDKINDLLLKDKITKIEAIYKKEVETAQGNKEMIARLTKEKNQKIELEESKHKTKRLQNEIKFQDDLENLKDDEVSRMKEQVKEQEFELKIAMRNELLIAKKTSKSKAEFKKKEYEIRKRYHDKEKELLIDMIKSLIIEAKAMGLVTKELEKMLKLIESSSFDSTYEENQQKLSEILDLANQFNDALGDLADAFIQRRIEQINAEIDAETKKYDKLIDLAEDDKDKKLALEQEKADTIANLEKERLKEEQRQARIRKAFALSDIAINTARAIVKLPADGGFLGLAAVPVMIALGALQAAAVLATPIPQYKDGVKDVAEAHIGMINDGGKQEYLERDGKIFTTRKKNALIQLRPKDTVYKDYDDMVSNSMIVSSILNGVSVKENEFNALFDTISGGIEEGFKNTKNINNFKFVDRRRNNSYKQHLSRWN